MLDDGPRTADVVAVTCSRLLLVPRDHLLAMLRQHPALPFAMMRLLCHRLRDTSQGLERVALQRLPSRLAHPLLSLAAEYGQPAPANGILLPMRLSQGEIAAWVAATREAVNKQLAEWREGRLIRLKAGRISILQPSVLAAARE